MQEIIAGSGALPQRAVLPRSGQAAYFSLKAIVWALLIGARM